MTTASRVPVLMDVDTGVDDAIALATAVGTPELELVAVSSVAGNVDVEKTTANTLAVLAMLGAPDVPVHRGASRPLARMRRDAAHFHGADGLGESRLPVSRRGAGPDRGPAAIIRHVLARPGELTLVCVGPLTNLAIALNVAPELPQLFRSVVVMGGAFFQHGNVTPYAEFNIYADPEAAEQVFAAPFPDLIVVGLDVTEHVSISRAQWERMSNMDRDAAALVYRICRRSFEERGAEEFHLHDPLALAVAVYPELVATKPSTIEVVTDGVEEGRTRARPGGDVSVAHAVDTLRFETWFWRALGMDEDIAPRA
ncbi:MAG TPA: nucleoside hydrolase [Thermomicrobiales bacterium]|nr:nucleoside hydrolase [Thermomicrobiales bacterium]